MRELFAAELDAWGEAQASGMTLIEHVSRVEETAPVSTSEAQFSDEPEEELDDDELEEDAAEPPADDEATQAMPPEFAAGLAREHAVGAATAVAAKAEARAAPEPEPAPEPEAAPRASQPAIAAVDASTPFPVAPREWRVPTEPMPEQRPQDFIARYRNELFYAGVGLFVLVLLVAMVCR